MKCAKCGRDNRDGAGFCAWCGAPTGVHAATDAAPSVATQPRTAMPFDVEPAINPTEFDGEPAPIEPEPEAAPAAQPDSAPEPSDGFALRRSIQSIAVSRPAAESGSST